MASDCLRMMVLSPCVEASPTCECRPGGSGATIFAAEMFQVDSTLSGLVLTSSCSDDYARSFMSEESDVLERIHGFTYFTESTACLSFSDSLRSSNHALHTPCSPCTSLPPICALVVCKGILASLQCSQLELSAQHTMNQTD